MCLYADLKATAALRKQHSKTDVVKRYKVVKANLDVNGDLAITSKVFGHFNWKPGVMKSGLTKKPKLTKAGAAVNDAIHVYVTRNDAVNYGAPGGIKVPVMEVECCIKDLIACNGRQETYTQVTLQEAEYNKLGFAMAQYALKKVVEKFKNFPTNLGI